MTESERNKAYLHWMYQTVGMGNHRLFGELRSLGEPEEVYELARHGRLIDRLSGKYGQRENGQYKLSQYKISQYEKKAALLETSAQNCNAEAEYERMTDRGILITVVGEEDYPSKLATVPDAPGALYYVGRLPQDNQITIAVIGARNCSEYGRAMAKQYGEVLAEAGIQVVSGMARGIDGIAQQAALKEGGYSLGVLGCGVDICYPRENRILYEELIAEGGICSEYPPGIEPRAVLFPPRNRIISGLCDGVLVIEAKERSGTLITVDMALEQGREVYAVPGRTTDPLSRGCNRLIRQGAEIVMSPQELVQELLPGCVGRTVYEQQELPVVDDVRGRLLKILDYQPIYIETIQRKYADAYDSHISVSELCHELLQLCADGYAGQIGGSYYVRQS